MNAITSREPEKASLHTAGCGGSCGGLQRHKKRLSKISRASGREEQRRYRSLFDGDTV
jgi:hypothetical protein